MKKHFLDIFLHYLYTVYDLYVCRGGSSRREAYSLALAAQGKCDVLSSKHSRRELTRPILFPTLKPLNFWIFQLLVFSTFQLSNLPTFNLNTESHTSV